MEGDFSYGCSLNEKCIRLSFQQHSHFNRYSIINNTILCTYAVPTTEWASPNTSVYFKQSLPRRQYTVVLK